MDRHGPAGSRKRATVVAGCVLGAVLIVLSPQFGRAEPSGRYRPPLPPDALTTGCYPLPTGLTIDFPYQVRTDEDLADGRTRRLVLQYDEIDADQARRDLAEALVRAGFTPRARGDVLDYAKPGVGQVRATITPIPRLGDDDLVRGTVELILPKVARTSDAPECLDRFSTKRFAEAEQDR
ncbi:hypothetical protein EFK50_05050 [Nocardioides marmoriginsengisoli]|uniref:Uncharacterized protein n=1 Tax=Nocardioides marmoriginsengisoli TaxID=661483 RepID=A0A3N0CPR2_9ACTN|nr:hypothetical protein [Nocardioides marmoriginsengisoli]RNL65329.1 hypothetical protein EFK50_05050 [Nocardioides marmoriginsengisoli]